MSKDKCPHCGGITGYRNKELHEYERQTDWGEDGYASSQAEHCGLYKTYKRRYCMDCGGCVSAYLDEPEFKL